MAIAYNILLVCMACIMVYIVYIHILYINKASQSVIITNNELVLYHAAAKIVLNPYMYMLFVALKHYISHITTLFILLYFTYYLHINMVNSYLI